MASELHNLPPELEENLAKTVERVIKRRGFPNLDLSNILKAISMAVKMESKFKETINDQRWIEGFKRRWAHKIVVKKEAVNFGNVHRALSTSSTFGIKRHSGSTADLSEKVYKMINSNRLRRNRTCGNQRSPSYSELHGSAKSPIISTTASTSSKQASRSNRISNAPEKKRQRREFSDESSDSSNFDSSDACEDSSDDTTDSSIGHKSERNEPIEISDSEEGQECSKVTSSKKDWENYTRIRRAAMGLRNTLKPVDRFQISTKLNTRKKKLSKSNTASIDTSSEDESPLSEKETPVSSSAEDNRQKKSQNKGRKNFEIVRMGEIKLEDMCLTCGTSEEVEAKHPLFNGGLCKEHKTLFREWFFKYDSDGYHSYCSVCCMGNKVVLCDIQDCGRCYCKDCLDTLVEEDYFDKAVSSEHWVCNFCSTSSNSLLRKRPEWQEVIQELYKNTGESQFPSFSVPPPTAVNERRSIRVLSLFDGISTGLVALKQLGLRVEKLVASEIDEDAIRLVQNKHPEVVHVGDITKLTDDEIYEMGPFDLLMGGSPCNDLSGANPKRRGLLDSEGSGCLFFDFYRVLRTIEPPRSEDGRHQRPFFWLFENVVSMKGIEKRRISRFLQCEPKMADARYVGAAARPRLFWGNIPGLKDRNITPGVKDRLTVQDCLEPGRKALVEKLNTITTKYTCLYQGQTRKAPVMHDGKEDVLWTTEVERVFGVPEHYTDVNNLGPRERLALLGRSWSVPVVRLLLSPLKEYFSGIQPGIKEEKLPNASWWN